MKHAVTCTLLITLAYTLDKYKSPLLACSIGFILALILFYSL